MVIRMGEVFDRIDTKAERDAAVRMMCVAGVDTRTRERVTSAIMDYDKRRAARLKEVLASNGAISDHRVVKVECKWISRPLWVML